MKEKPKIDYSKIVVSPMPGNIVSVAVKAGDTVAQGQELAVVEAMKMQNVLHAPRVGVIKNVLVQAGISFFLLLFFYIYYFILFLFLQPFLKHLHFSFFFFFF